MNSAVFGARVPKSIPAFVISVFVLIFPLMTGRMSDAANRNAFWVLGISATLAAALLYFRVRSVRSDWNRFSRIVALAGGFFLAYALALLGLTFGLHRPEIFFLIPLGLGAASVLLRPSVLRESISQEVRLSLAALVVTIMAACFVTAHQHVALLGNDFRKTGYVAFLGCVVLFFYVVIFVRFRELKWWTIVAALCGGLLVSVVALWQFFDPGESARNWFFNLRKDPRSMGTMGHPNWLGTYLCLILPLAVAMFLDAKTSAARLGAAFSCALLFASLLVCQTRGAWVAVACFLLWLAFCRRFSWRKILPLFVVFAIVTAILLPCKNGEIFRRMSTFGREASRAGEGSAATGSGRFGYWIYGLQHLPPHLLLGAGLDTFGEVGARDKTPPRSDKAHSLYLEYALTLGLPGLALYLFFLWSCVKPFPGKPENMIRWGLRASIGTYLIQGIFIHDTIHTWPMVWIIAGLAAARVAPLQPESEMAPCIGQQGRQPAT